MLSPCLRFWFVGYVIGISYRLTAFRSFSHCWLLDVLRWLHCWILSHYIGMLQFIATLLRSLLLNSCFAEYAITLPWHTIAHTIIMFIITSLLVFHCYYYVVIIGALLHGVIIAVIVYEYVVLQLLLLFVHAFISLRHYQEYVGHDHWLSLNIRYYWYAWLILPTPFCRLRHFVTLSRHCRCRHCYVDIIIGHMVFIALSFTGFFFFSLSLVIISYYHDDTTFITLLSAYSVTTHCRHRAASPKMGNY